jgi:hypothetical protein
MVAGRKKQQGSRGAAATPEKESGKGKEKAAKGKEPAKEKQKQKGKQKEAREDGKETAKAKQQQQEEAAAAKSAGQQFFKIFFPNQSGERLVSFFTASPVSFNPFINGDWRGLCYCFSVPSFSKRELLLLVVLLHEML